MIFRRKRKKEKLSKKELKELKEELKKNKKRVEKQLKSFAKEDKKLEGDWDSKYPDFDGGSAGGERRENEAMELEEYSSRLPVEHSLELKLKDINLALKKIKEEKYGVCEKCEKLINKERLKAYPSARTCVKCNK